MLIVYASCFFFLFCIIASFAVAVRQKESAFSAVPIPWDWEYEEKVAERNFIKSKSIKDLFLMNFRSLMVVLTPSFIFLLFVLLSLINR